VKERQKNAPPSITREGCGEPELREMRYESLFPIPQEEIPPTLAYVRVAPPGCPYSLFEFPCMILNENRRRFPSAAMNGLKHGERV